MRAAALTLVFLAGILLAPPPAAASGLADRSVETPRLIVSAVPGAVPEGGLAAFAERTEGLLGRILELWGVDDGVERLGKIRVILDHPQRNTSSSVFFWLAEDGRRVRAVRVFGSPEAPQMLAHKLTSALMPQRDKLLRNMLGILSERRLGNPDAFPMCGHRADAWVLAFLDAGTYLPLRELGPDHAAWGMADAGGGRMQVLDRARQHRAYVEAGSFAEWLLAAFGPDALKRLQRLSQGDGRPFRQALGADLEELEGRWLAALRTREPELRDEASLLGRMFARNPARACFAAQAQADGR